MSEAKSTDRFNILCLDGGGAKGFYSIGFLRELEALVGEPLSSHFHAIYGTSTGAIIGSLLGLGKSVGEVLQLYQENVPKILGARNSARKSAKLKEAAEQFYGGVGWSDFQARIGIVATNWTHQRPLIFKDQVHATYSMKGTFIPGFGCSIADAVRASCSATPFFKPCVLDLTNDGRIEARDGGFCANNPSLIAASDALNAWKVPATNIRLLSLGVGHYPEPKRKWLDRQKRKLEVVQILKRTLNVSSNTIEVQTRLLLPQIRSIRISDRYESPELALDFTESNVEKLDLLVQKGRSSYSTREKEIDTFFN
ncbi:MAG: patatin-like phospholipase family protein [Flavobacteriales bacterium]|nr:patatin-like phospholipase family protein [Flavobacteriales bacterium]